MSQDVRVTSIAALSEFRAALCTFGEDAKAALGNAEMDVRRTTDWLVRGQAPHWQAEIKRGQLAVADAQAALFRRKISQGKDSPPNDSEQKEALRNAKRRLAHAEEKLKTIKKWIPIFQHAVSEFHARSRPLGDMIEGDLKNGLVLLDRMVVALDAYTRIAPPPGMAAAEPQGVGASRASAGSDASLGSMAAGNPPPPETETEPDRVRQEGEPIAVEEG